VKCNSRLDFDLKIKYRIKSASVIAIRNECDIDIKVELGVGGIVLQTNVEQQELERVC